eukprot:gene16150-22310_t
MVGSCRNKADNERLKMLATPETPTHALRVARLKMVGSCRNEADNERLKMLQAYAQELGISNDVEWHVNVSFTELQQLLGDAVAHNSAGPKEDIVVPQPSGDGEYADQITGFLAETVEEYAQALQDITGFLAETLEEYAQALQDVLMMSQVDRLQISAAAQRHAARFSQERFLHDFTAAMRDLLENCTAPA